MKKTCSCGEVWTLDAKPSKRRVNTVNCDCGEVLVTSFGCIEYEALRIVGASQNAGTGSEERLLELLAQVMKTPDAAV